MASICSLCVPGVRTFCPDLQRMKYRVGATQAEADRLNNNNAPTRVQTQILFVLNTEQKPLILSCFKKYFEKSIK